MWYPSEAHTERERVSPGEIVAAVEADLGAIVREDLESNGPGISGKTPARAKANMVSTGPGTEYWLP